MKISLTNNYLTIPSRLVTDREKFFINYLNELSKIHEVNYYEVFSDSNDETYIRIPRGFLELMNINLGVEDESSISIPSIDLTKEQLEVCSKILSRITLRYDQLMTIYMMFKYRSGICQLGTGAGKTEIMAGYLKMFHYLFSRYPHTIIVEPTNNLVDQTINRLSNYGIEIEDYKVNRDINGISVTHPMSLLNDIYTNHHHTDKLEVILFDEGHHVQAKSWYELLSKSSNLNVKIALSASIIEDVSETNLHRLAPMEVFALGVFGKVLVNYALSYYIQIGVLATPIVVRLINLANEKLVGRRSKACYKYNNVDYHLIKKCRIRSSNRYRLAVDMAKRFTDYGRQVLILVSTKEEALDLSKKMYEVGVGPTSCIFGGNVSTEYSPSSDKLVGVDYNSLDEFKNRRTKVLIGTSVLYEGIDVPNLDVVILFSVGKKSRVIIQSIGRGLRRSKTGKYAYIVDFTDSSDKVLNSQSMSRKQLYKSILGLPDYYIVESDVDYATNLFKALESIEE